METHETKPSSEFKMKSKEEYMNPDGSVARFKFHIDIRRAARDSQVSVPVVLREFFNRYTFTKREMGSFALYTTTQANVVEGAVNLIHALEITEENAPSLNIMPEYFDFSTDPQNLGISWTVDNLLSWKQGTVMSESMQYLEKL